MHKTLGQGERTIRVRDGISWRNEAAGLLFFLLFCTVLFRVRDLVFLIEGDFFSVCFRSVFVLFSFCFRFVSVLFPYCFRFVSVLFPFCFRFVSVLSPYLLLLSPLVSACLRLPPIASACLRLSSFVSVCLRLTLLR